MAKIFERAFPLEFTPLPLPTLRLVFCSTLTPFAIDFQAVYGLGRQF